jgi:membrane protein implicated in regulation of membrane protease activity
MVAATAAVILRAGFMASWFGWVSAVFAAGLVFPLVNWLFIMGFPVWVLGVSVVLWRRAGRREITLADDAEDEEPIEYAIPPVPTSI